LGCAAAQPCHIKNQTRQSENSGWRAFFISSKVLSDSLQKPRMIFLRKLVFPNPQHPPIGPPQGARHEFVARDVPGKFPAPERRIALRLCSMLWTAVPETAVHKQCQPRLSENKIRANAHTLSALGRGPG